MKLSAPKQITWIVAVVMLVLAIIFKVANVGFDAFWVAYCAGVLLAVATFVAGL